MIRNRLTDPDPLALDPKKKGLFVGYYADWMQWGNCPITPEKVPADRYTHINYAFASFDGNTGNFGDLDANFVKRVMDMKKRNKDLSVMASLGGGSFSSGPWTKLMNNNNAKNKFFGSVKAWLDKYNFDGLDIDWEFPQKGEQDKVVELFREIRKAIGNEKLLTTAGPSAYFLNEYVPEKWVQYTDFINVMNYDYAGSWSGKTGHLAPLYGGGSIDDTMKAYVKRGVPAEKLVFGFANYAVTWTVDGNNGLGAAATKGGNPGRCSNSAGYLGASEIEDLYKVQGFKLHWDNTAKVPYAYFGNQFASFDNQTSIDFKAEYIKKNNFAGGMLWLIDSSTTISDHIWKKMKDL